MSPAITIDEEVFERLQEHAAPLVDTPNTVLRRILGMPWDVNGVPVDDESEEAGNGSHPPVVPSRARPTTQRARPGTVLPETDYELPILAILAEKGGRARTREVLDALGERLDGKLTPTDRGPLASGEIRWRNRAQFVRLKLIDRGDMSRDSRHGIWEISEQGRRRLDANGRGG